MDESTLEFSGGDPGTGDRPAHDFRGGFRHSPSVWLTQGRWTEGSEHFHDQKVRTNETPHVKIFSLRFNQKIVHSSNSIRHEFNAALFFYCPMCSEDHIQHPPRTKRVCFGDNIYLVSAIAWQGMEVWLNPFPYWICSVFMVSWTLNLGELVFSWFPVAVDQCTGAFIRP